MKTRLIYDKLCESEQLAAVGDSAERLFFRLLSKVDDAGRFRGDAIHVLASCWPLCGKTIEETEQALAELESVGLIQRYTVKSLPYLHLPQFPEHQRFRTDRKKTVLYPEPHDNHLATTWQPPDNQPETTRKPTGTKPQASPISHLPSPISGRGSVGTEPPAQPKHRKRTAKELDTPEARRIIDTFNRHGRHFGYSKTQLAHAVKILAVAQEHTERLDLSALEIAQRVIRHKANAAGGQDDRFYFRPSTFAVAANFENYLEEMRSGVKRRDVSNGRQPEGGSTRYPSAEQTRALLGRIYGDADVGEETQPPIRGPT